MKKRRFAAALLAAVMMTSAVPDCGAGLNFSVTASAASLLPAPTGIKAAALSDRSIKLSWKAVSGAIGYRIYKYADWRKEFIAETLTANTEYTVTGLTEDKQYRFKIVAVTNTDSGFKEQTMSGEIKVVTLLAAPLNFTASPKSLTSVKLKWNKNSKADAYRVYIMDSSTGKFRKYKDVTGDSCTVKGLKRGSEYSFAVAALVRSGSKYKVQTMSDAGYCMTDLFSYKGLPVLPEPGTTLTSYTSKLWSVNSGKNYEQSGYYGTDVCYYVTVNGVPGNYVRLMFNEDGKLYGSEITLQTGTMTLAELRKTLEKSGNKFTKTTSGDDTVYYRESGGRAEMLSQYKDTIAGMYYSVSLVYAPQEVLDSIERQKEQMQGLPAEYFSSSVAAFKGVPEFPAFGLSMKKTLEKLGISEKNAAVASDGSKCSVNISVNGQKLEEAELYFENDKLCGYSYKIPGDVMSETDVLRGLEKLYGKFTVSNRYKKMHYRDASDVVAVAQQMGDEMWIEIVSPKYISEDLKRAVDDTRKLAFN